MEERSRGYYEESPHINRVLVFIIVAISLLMTTADTTIVATALETLQEKLDTTTSWIGWTITAYSFGFVLMLPLSAKLSTILGPRRVYLWSVGGFTIASLLCGLVNSIYTMIPLRVIQALGAAGITPSVTAIIVQHFGSARDRAVSLFGSIFPIGVMIGPIFGGLFVTYLTWRWIFFLNIPLGIAVILLSLRYIPKDYIEKAQNKAKLDLPGLLWLGLGILAGMFAATYLSEKSAEVLSYQFIGLIVVSVIGLIGFFRHINRKRDPFIMPRFVYGKGFGTVNLMNLIYAGATAGSLSLVPLFVANRYGISALNASFMLIAQGGTSVIFSTVMSLLLRKTGYRPPMVLGCSVIILGMAGIALPPSLGLTPFWWMTFSTSFIGAGMGILSPPARNAGLQLAPEASATIAALRTQCLQLGSILIIGIATAIVTDTAHPGEVHAWVYAGVAALYFLGLPMIKGIPEHKGSW